VLNLWIHRGLALNFFQREIRTRYIGSVSGLLWTLLHPLALLAIYAFVFTTIFRVKLPDLEGFSFVAFVAVALWPWLAFQEAVQRGLLCVQNNAGLIKKVAFPSELLVLSSVCATYTVHLLGFLLVLCVLTLMGNDLHLEMLPVVIILLFAQLLFTFGFASILAALQVLLKDVEHILLPLLMIWFYATPVLYPISIVPEKYQQLMSINPMLYFAERMRDVLMQGNGLVLSDLGVLAAALLFYLASRWFFTRLETSFEDFL
jgi:ABC-type polysaccharide/polyol phosphate export permease